MNIGIDASRAVRPQRTGTENYSLYLIAALLRLGTDHSFRLYFNQPPAENLFPAQPGIEQMVMPFPRLWTHLRLSAEMLSRPPDVLFVPAHVLPLMHPRSVATVHDLGYHFFPEAHTTRERLYLEWGTRYNARASRLIIADSRCTRDDLARIHGAAQSKVRVAYPGIRPGMVRVEDPSAVAKTLIKYGIPDRYVLYVGTLQPRKNLVRLIEAFAGIPEPHVLVLAGKKGWLYADILSRSERLGIGRRVLFTGYVPDEVLPTLLSAADMFAFPSLYEGFGMPVLEAMACGTPVVCSNSSSLPEIAGDAALIVSPTDVDEIRAAMLRVLTHADLRNAMVERGFKQAAGFTWARCAQVVLSALEEVAA